MHCSISVELRYRRHKYSAETKHYELLYGVVEELGVYSSQHVDRIIDLIKQSLGREIDDTIIEPGKRRVLRVYVDSETVRRIIEVLGAETGIPLKDDYDYVIQVTCND